MKLQWLIAERGPRVQELLSNPKAQELFTSDNMNTLFGALDRPVPESKAEILSDLIRLEQGQFINSMGKGPTGSEFESTKVIRELLEFWGPRAARKYWDIVMGDKDKFHPIKEDQVARFGHLLE
jgi:hypothetical protein